MIRVVPTDERVAPFLCDVLESAFSRDTRLEVGDIVLALSPSSAQENGCILERVSAYRPAQPVPEHVVVEAAEKLTLKCGDASLDIRKDGNFKHKLLKRTFLGEGPLSFIETFSIKDRSLSEALSYKINSNPLIPFPK